MMPHASVIPTIGYPARVVEPEETSTRTVTGRLVRMAATTNARSTMRSGAQ